MRSDVLGDRMCSIYDNQAILGGTRADKTAEINLTGPRPSNSSLTSPRRAQFKAPQVKIVS